MNIVHILGELIFPSKCILCGGTLKRGEQDLCAACRAETPRSSTAGRRLQFLDSFVSVWYYEGNVRRSLLRYKFRNARHYADGYGRILAMRLLEEYPDGFDMITWVPISTLRKLRRGYDQVELLAKAVGRELDIRPERTLKKIRHNPPQSGIDGYAERRANVLGAYRVEKEEAVRGKRVLLLDDVITTGATAGECARVLLTAGAKEVHCAAVASAGKHK